MTIFSTNLHMVSDGILRLAVTGEVDLATADLLTDAITSVITAGQTAELLIDLDRVTFLGAAGVRSLICGHNLAAAFGIGYLVINPHGIVRRVLDITGALRLLTELAQPAVLL